MKIYTPPEKIQRNIEIVLAEYNPDDFFRYLDGLDYPHIEKVETVGGEANKEYFKQIFDFLPLDPDSEDGIPFVEVMDRMAYVPEDTSIAVLAGLKEFFSKKYDERSFIMGGELLGAYYPDETNCNGELFEILENILKLDERSDKLDPVSLNRRYSLLIQAAWYGNKTSDSEYVKRASEYRSRSLKMEEKIIFLNKIYRSIGGQ